MGLIRYLRQASPSGLWIAIVMGVISGLAGAGLVAVIHARLNHLDQATPPAWVFFALCALLLGSRMLTELRLLRMTQDAILSLRLRLSRALLDTPLAQLEALGKHRLLVILSEDITTFTNAFEWVPVLFVNAIMVLACLAYLSYLSPLLVAALALALLVGMGAFHYAERRPLMHLRKVREQKDALYQHYRALVEGTRELKLNRAKAEDFVARVLQPSAQAFRHWFLRGMAGYTLVANLGGQLFYLLIGVVLFLLPSLIAADAEVLSGFVITLLFMIRPVVDMMIALPSLRQASISLGKIEQLAADLARSQTDLPPCTPQLEFPRAPSGLTLSARGLGHSYPREGEEQPFQLGPVDFTLRAGELVFLVGGNGSGKTTLAHVLLGLYPPERGELLLNGRAVDATNVQAYREHFSAIFADFHLFQDLLGLDQNNPALAQQAQHYIQRLQLGHKLAVQEGRFSTVKLSTGQRKRLALVAAYLEDRPICLFDEWASDQDPSFKQVFYRELLPELRAQGKLVIVISHDDAYFDCADRVIKLRDGQWVESSPQAPVAAVRDASAL